MGILDKLIDDIIVREGGYVNNPKDKGGPTRYGITEAVARKNGWKGDMRELPRDFAVDVLRNIYIVHPGFDKVAELSPIIAFELVDTYVNMGAGNKATKDGPIFWLQAWLNVFNREQKDYADIDVDGVVGDDVITSLRGYLRKRGVDGAQNMAKALNGEQTGRYRRLCEARQANEEFAYGWIKNRVELPPTPVNPVRPLGILAAASGSHPLAGDPVEAQTFGPLAADDKPTFCTWLVTYLKLRLGEGSTLVGAGMLVTGLATNADFFASARSVYDAVHSGQGIGAIATAAISLGMILYKQRTSPSVAEHLASK